MRRVLMLVVGLLAVVSLLVVGCSKSAPATSSSPKPTVKEITAFGDAFGDSTYCIMTGLEKLFGNNPLMRLYSTETPGGLWDVKEVMEKPEIRKKTIIPLSISIQTLALNGTKPFYDKAYPEAKDLKAIFFFDAGLITFATLDKKLEDPTTWGGKRIGLGREAQLWWAQAHKAVVEQGYGLNASYSFLGPTEAVGSLIDGKVQLCPVGGYFTGDLSKCVLHDSAIQLNASGRDYYYAKLSKDAIEKGAKISGLGFTAGQVPANVFPNQPDPIWAMQFAQGFGAYKDFPDELAYEIAKMVTENCSKLALFHAVGSLLSPKSIATGFSADYYHPGALKYYKEAGLIK